MLAVFNKPETSKHLYFNLNNSFHLSDPEYSPTYKIAGLYAIYKNDVCYYVGQSKNLPSRISTHLTGKYKTADRVDVTFIGDVQCDSFYSRDRPSQKAILENNEQWLIAKLNPIENLVVNNNVIAIEDLIDRFRDIENNDDSMYAHLSIFMDDTHLTVSDSPYESIASIHPCVLKEYEDEVISVADYMRGLEYE